MTGAYTDEELARLEETLGAAVGDTVRVDACADGETLRVTVVEDDR